MNSSFYNGVSGIKVHQFGMDVWADNVSNINNNGFKAVRPEFSNVFSQTLTQSYFSPAFGQVGLGAMGQTTAMDQKGGSFVDSDNPFDMGIKGEGWFGTIDRNGEIFYTRKGDFSLDAVGNLVAKNGNFLLGTLGNNIKNGKVLPLNEIKLASATAQTNMQFPKTLSMDALATTTVTLKGNLNPQVKKDFVETTLDDKDIVQKVDKDTKKLTIDGTLTNTKGVLEPKVGDIIFITMTDKNKKTQKVEATLDKDNKWSLKEYDVSMLDTSEPLTITASIKSKQEIATKETFSTPIITTEGKKYLLKVNFIKQVPQEGEGTVWNTTATIEDEKKKVLQTQEGVVSFSKTGGLLSSTLKTIENGTAKIDLNFGDAKEGVNGGFGGVTAITSGIYGKNGIEANGHLKGDLTRYQVDQYGYIMAVFNNNKSVAVGRIPVYHFQNDQGLTRVGGNYFQESANSGKAIFYTDKDGKVNLGTTLVTQKLETSNVNLATALTEVIVMQKAFHASSKSITTSDQMIQQAINMKR